MSSVLLRWFGVLVYNAVRGRAHLPTYTYSWLHTAGSLGRMF
jgi:hypothetical protein